MEKGGRADTLTAAGITAEQGVGWADEMRVGQIGTTRRVWGRCGVKVCQRIQRVYEWRYLHLVVDPLQGRLWWFWSHSMQATVARTLVEVTQTETDLAALVWDRARGALWALAMGRCEHWVCRSSSNRRVPACGCRRN